ncbi:hypothetical protein GCM10009872_13690 [Actinopolymorpha rutila]
MPTFVRSPFCPAFPGSVDPGAGPGTFPERSRAPRRARSDRETLIRRADPRLGRVWEAAFVAVLLVLVLAVGLLGAYVLRNLLRRPRRGPQNTDQRNGS